MSTVTVTVPETLLDAIATRMLELQPGQRRWLEIEALADHLGMPLSRVRYLRAIGLPARKVGRRLIFDLHEVDAFLEGLERA